MDLSSLQRLGPMTTTEASEPVRRAEHDLESAVGNEQTIDDAEPHAEAASTIEDITYVRQHLQLTTGFLAQLTPLQPRPISVSE